MGNKRFIVVALTVILVSGCAGSSGRISTPRSGANAASQVFSSNGDASLAAQSGFQLSGDELSAARKTEQRALESIPAGQNLTWQGKQPGRSGSVTVAQPYRVGSQDCRPYSHVITVGAESRSIRGTACRNPNGSWAILN